MLDMSAKNVRWRWSSWLLLLPLVVAWPWLAAAEDATLSAAGDVTESVAAVALDDDEAAFLRDRLADVAPAEAQSILEELAGFPKLDEASVRREFAETMPPPEVKYSPAKLAEVKAAADRQFTAYRKGEAITVPIPYGAGVSREFTGEFHGLFETQTPGQVSARNRKVKIGGRFFMVDDFPADIQARFDAAVMAERHHEFLQREYYQPRKTYIAAYQDLLDRHVQERRNTYCDDRRQQVRARVAALRAGDAAATPQE
jgi:hypothetical protein